MTSSTHGAPLISVIVPTRERAITLGATIRSALAQNSDRFELIVCDNSSTDETSAVIAGFSDPRLRSFQTDRRLSMCDNWECALERSRGTYAIVIGDDDALSAGAIEDLERHIDQVPASIYFWDAHVYRWPVEGEPAVFQRRAAEPGGTTVVDIARLARRAYRLAGMSYTHLPLLYHSLVATDVLDSIRRRTGRVFHSTQPDVFLAFALPVFSPTAVKIGRSVSLYGVTEKPSLTPAIKARDGAFAEKIHRFLGEYGDYRFHRSLDPSAPPWVNMIPDAPLVAGDLFPEFYKDIRFSYENLWAFYQRYWDFSTTRAILRQAPSVGPHHPFSRSKFLAWWGVNRAIELRQRWRARRQKQEGETVAHCLDIYDFAQHLARDRR